MSEVLKSISNESREEELITEDLNDSLEDYVEADLSGHYEWEEIAEEEEEEEEEAERYEITPEQLIRFKEGFALFDDDEDGKIPTALVPELIRFLGFTPTDGALKTAIKKLMVDPKGHVEFEYFYMIAAMVVKEPITDEEIFEAFHVFDEDELKFVRTEELRHALGMTGERFKDPEMIEFLKACDPKGTGKCKYPNFIAQMYKKLSKVPPVLPSDMPKPEPKRGPGAKVPPKK